MEEMTRLQKPASNKDGHPSCLSTRFASAAFSPSSSIEKALPCFFSADTPSFFTEATVKVASAGINSLTSPSRVDRAPSEDFDFSARFSEADQLWPSTPMSSADELFCNGQIRPLWNTEDDLYHSYPTQFKHAVNNSNNCRYFSSSADYKFSMSSLQQSFVSATSLYGLSSRNLDEQLCMVEAKGDAVSDDPVEAVGSVQTTAENTPSQTSRRPDVGAVAKPAMKAKVEGIRGRCIVGGSIGRTRSLCPLRVFHMDDDLPKQMTENQFVKSDEDVDAGKALELKQKWEGVEIPVHGTRVTLKQLLHASEKGEHGFSSKTPACLISKWYKKAQLDTKASERKFKSSPKLGLEDSRKSSYCMDGVQGPGSFDGRRYSSPKLHSERMRPQTYLPYKPGLLACLGFSSKSYQSVARMRSFHSQSRSRR